MRDRCPRPGGGGRCGQARAGGPCSPSAAQPCEPLLELIGSPTSATLATSARSNHKAARQGGWYNLGIAHGVAGVIAFLGSLCRIGVAAERAAPLLADSVAWLLTRELPAGGDYRFKCTYTPDRDIDICRLGWCHGDLAVATALLVAARGANEPSWEQHARRIARSAAALTVDNTPVPDASLCHGAAGIGHLFNRLYQETDEPSLGEAARSWLHKAVAMREPGRGIGGYQQFERGKKYNNPGFRVGSSGIALALLAAASSVPPGWDRLLMAS